ncbi:MAG: fibronectin type III domain-containing protein [Candidatus Kerfeldbacteria bacterium]|nr:fibronectin type III domain-containing protein [Candidatus Kerfeldbacteria bacterium]
MLTRPAIFKHSTRPWPLLLAMLVLVASLVGERAAVEAQGERPPRVISVTTAVTANSATITFTTDVEAEARIRYGQSAAYDLEFPIGGTFVAAVAGEFTKQLSLAGLNPGTTYHFTIETRRVGSTDTASTPDRTFTTASGAGGGAALTINDIGMDCIGANCRLSFSTSVDANVQVRWDTSPHGSFSDYVLGAAGEPAGFYSAALRSLDLTGLALGTTYHYMMQGTDRGGSTFLTGDLTFTTGADGDDRTFSTGACADGTPIGGCSRDGGYCEPGGVLVYRCDSICGFTCPVDQTCNDSGLCLVDPPLTGSPNQCNNSNCYTESGVFKAIAPAGCFRSWPRCNANTILKVRKDRSCNLWLSCETSLQTQPSSSAPAENLCLSLAACNSLGPNGQCNRFLPSGQCSNNPLRFCSTDADCEAGGSCNAVPADEPTRSLQDLQFSTPDQISQIANLSGNVIAGLDWDQVADVPVIRGNLPWQLMRQIGGVTQAKNGDLEYQPPNPDPWISAPPGEAPVAKLVVEFEDQDTSPNHVLKVDPAKDPDTDKYLPFSGAATGEFSAAPGEYYFAEARVRADAGSPQLRFQFGYEGYTKFVGNDDPFVASAAWQRVTIGPVKGLRGQTRFAVVCRDEEKCGPFWIDDVQIKPVLQVNTTPSYVTPTCRLYPKEDSPACDYVDKDGVQYSGWQGYCLEHDSVTGTCLSWWPADLIKGQSNIFGSETQAGYDGRSPLYLCLEAAGNNRGVVGEAGTQPYVVGKANYNVGRDFEAFCGGTRGVQYTIGQCCTTCIDGAQRGLDRITKVDASGPELNLHEDEITKVVWVPQPVPGEDVRLNPGFEIINNDKFRFSSRALPAAEADYWAHHYRVWRDTPPYDYPDEVQESANYIIWRWETDPAECRTHTNGNCVTARLFFDKNTREFKKYHLIVDDQTDGGDEEMLYRVYFYTRESCRAVAQVVDPDGNSEVFAERVKSNFIVPDLNYGLISDLTPFGGVLPPSEAGAEPETWPLLPVEFVNTTAFEFGQARGGSPYACNGNCQAVICSANHGFSCLKPDGTADAAAVNRCQTVLDVDGDGLPDGQCTGVIPPIASARGRQSVGAHDPTGVDPDLDRNYFAQERIRRLFVRSLGVWRWENNKYVLQPGPGWEPPDELCPVDPDVPSRRRRPSYPTDYCAVPPEADNAQFLSGTSKLATITGGSGVVGIKFNTAADAEQVPLKQIIIDWGDTQDTIAFPFAPRNDPSKPHIVSHVYIANPGNPACRGGAGGRVSCEFRIKIQVEDNWGWCNDATAGTKCHRTIDARTGRFDSSTWYDTDLTVRVES